MALVTLSYLSIFSNDRIQLRGLSYFSDILLARNYELRSLLLAIRLWFRREGEYYELQIYHF